MSFKDVIVAGATLVRDAIQSGAFDTTQGWQIKQDGTATFNSMSARGDVTVGGIAGGDVSVANALAALAASGQQARAVDYADNMPVSAAGWADLYLGDCRTILQGMYLYIQTYGQRLPPNASIYGTISITCAVAPTTANPGGHFYHQFLNDVGAPEGTNAIVRGTVTGSSNAVSHHNFSMTYQQLLDLFNVFGSDTNRWKIQIRNTGSTPYQVTKLFYLLNWRVKVG